MPLFLLFILYISGWNHKTFLDLLASCIVVYDLVACGSKFSYLHNLDIWRSCLLSTLKSPIIKKEKKKKKNLLESLVEFHREIAHIILIYFEMCELDFITSSTFEQKFIITKLIRQSKYNLFISKCMDRILRISQLTQPIKNLNPKMYTFIVLVVYFLYLSKTKTLINFAFSY